ncbi:MAG: Activator of Hsp90 ATPase 1 family protein [Flavipsychrobacter sp.]|jgi:uncharacterized protein YndB with AHSA1/START domain|nr:Activator of Hsp90 ATPase 1 family protein [Flavipsychrobacter sp.]
MDKLQFTTDINAPREKVWKTMLDDATYRQWTTAFSPGSCAITDWKKGSKALFTDGSGSGMVARIEESIPYEFLSIEHLGEVKDGVEDTTSDRVKQWAGAHENYTFKDNNGGTRLIIDMDITEEFADMFKEMWPNALAKLKEIAEK